MKLLSRWPLLVLLVLPSQVWAGCSMSGDSRDLTIPLPAAIHTTHDTPVGKELWSSGWIRTSQGMYVSCSGGGSTTGTLAADIGGAVTTFKNNKGKYYVYATNVPGIGISIYFTEGYASTDARVAQPLTDRYSTSVIGGFYDWHIGVAWWVRLVKTGAITSTEPLAVTGVSVAGIHNLTLSRLFLSGTTLVTAPGCTVGSSSKDIAVTLPAVARTDFQGGAGALADNSKARAFSIDLSCDPQVAVNYRIDGQQASGVPDVLANATGPGMATGVGVQLFKGDTSSTTVQSLGVKQTHVVTTGQQQVQIPLAAKYYRTAQSASAITPGQVTARATFTMSYE